MALKNIEYFENGLPIARSIRSLIADFVESEGFLQIPCDFGYLPINSVRFAYENSELPIEPLISHLRKNGIAIMYIQEHKLNKYEHGFEYQKWHEIGFFAFTTEN